MLTLGHTSVQQFNHFLLEEKDPQLTLQFDLPNSVEVVFHGVGGRTVAKIEKYDWEQIRCLDTDKIILEIGSNDLCDPTIGPQTLADEVCDLVRSFQNELHTKLVTICQILPRQNVLVPPLVPNTTKKVFDTN